MTDFAMNTDHSSTGRRNWLWPRFHDEASAFEAARAGALGGVLVVAALVLALAVGKLASGPYSADVEPLQSYYVAQAIRIAVAGFLTWRVFRGEGRFASIFLLLWVLVAVGLKFALGEMNVAWGIAWLLAIFSLVHSVRASWALRRLKLA
jgi:hypothetical protein